MGIALAPRRVHTTGMLAGLLLVAWTPALSGGAPAVAHHERLVLLDLQANGVDANTVRTITDVVSTAFARHKELDVVAAADLRAMMNVEAAKQASACSGTDSCMADVAQALGADLLVHGSVGKLGDLLVVNVSLFDARVNRAIGREKVESTDASELSALLESAVDKLCALVAPAEPAVHFSAPLVATGAVLVVAGVVGVAAGGYFAVASYGALEDPASARASKESAVSTYPIALGAALFGGALTVGGVVVALLAVGVGGGE